MAKHEAGDLTCMTIQEFFETVLIPAIQAMSEEEKRELRETWLWQVEERQADRRFLRSCGVDPDGD